MPDSISKFVSALRSLGGMKIAAIGGGAFLALAAAVGAGAAPSPVAPISEVLGMGGEHGAAVSEAVHETKTAALEGEGEGEEDTSIGPALSEAACEAAHDRSTLPEGAQNAPGQAEGPEKDCTHPSNEESEDEEGSEEDLALLDEEEESLNHGTAVSQAVHDAKASLEEGDKVGPAVSEAACEAAHDRTTLPEDAQNAPGQAEGPEKDCTHPSSAEEGSEEETSEVESTGGSNGHGKDSAPGQQKKQGN
jgi:hypothetical protein